MDLQQTRGSNVSEVDGNARLSCGCNVKKKKKRSPQLLLQAQDNNKAIRTEHVVVAISLGGRHDPRRQSDLAAALAAVAAPPLGPT